MDTNLTSESELFLEAWARLPGFLIYTGTGVRSRGGEKLLLRLRVPLSASVLVSIWDINGPMRVGGENVREAENSVPSGALANLHRLRRPSDFSICTHWLHVVGKRVPNRNFPPSGPEW